MHHQQGARWREGKREDVLERAFELRALGKVAERFVKSWLSRRYSMNDSRLGVPDHLVQLEAELPERIELVVVLEPLRGETCGRALEDPAQLDRVVDVRTGELADDEPATRKRLEEPLVGDRHQRNPKRRPRDAELLDET